MKRYSLVCFLVLTAATLVAAQGGKAEPKRIQFAPGTTGTTLTGTLSNAQQMEFVFAARKGQTVSIKNTTSSLFDFKVYNDGYFSEGDFDSSTNYSFEAPENGDYMFFVRKKQVKTPRTARFSIRLAIK